MRSEIAFLCFLLIMGVSGSWTERAGAVSFEYQTTSWFFDVPLPEDSRWDSRTFCSSAPSALLNNRCNSSSPTIGTCCTTCVDGLPSVGSSGCVCSPVTGATCMDLSSNISGSVSPTRPMRFAVPVWNPTCRPLILVLNSLSGDADLGVDVGNPAFVSVPPSTAVGTPIGQTVRINQAQFGDDCFLFCQALSGFTSASGVVNPQWIHATNLTAPINWFFVNVESINLISAFTLQLSVVNSQNDFFVPLKWLNNRIDVKIDCGMDYHCQKSSTNASDPCQATFTNLYGDSPYAYHALAAGILSEDNLNASSGVTVSIPVVLKSDRLSTQSLVPNYGNISSCQLSFGGIVDANGAKLALAPFNFTTKLSDVDPSVCDSNSIQDLLSLIDQKRSSLQQVIQELGTDLSGLALLHGSLISNQHWVACDQMMSSFVERDLSSPLILEFNSTLCVHESGTQEWSVDPCCNTTLSFSSCCAPRTITYPFPSRYVLADSPIGQKTVVSQQCHSPKCSAVVSTRLLQARDARLRTELTCREQVASAVSDPRVFVDVASVCTQLLAAYERSEVSCSVDDNCYTNCSNNFCAAASNATVPFLSAIQSCLLDQMAPSVRAVFLAGRSPDVAMSAYFTVSCNQGSRQVYDPNLDTEAKCTSEFACNSDPNLSQDECERLSSQFPNMCAKCNGNLCQEFSRFAGCEVFPPVQSASECFLLRGTHWRNNACYIEGINSAAACLALANQFSINCAQQYSGATSCAPSCVFNTLFTTKSSCQCNPVGAAPGIPPIVYNWCDFFVWNERMSGVTGTGACTVETEDLSICFEINSAVSGLAAINRGSTWRGSSFLSSQAQCLGTGQPSPLVCSLPCANCSDPSCGVCSDLNANGFCMLPFHLVSTESGLILTCDERETVRYPDGCMNPNVEIATCQSQGGTWRSSSLTGSECLANRACFQPGAFRYGDRTPALFTSKSEQDCDACGSTSTPVNTWQQGAVLDRSEFQWLQRQWRSGVYSWEQTFSKTLFNQDYEAARSSFLFLAFQSTLSCLTSQDEAAIAQIACDCGSSQTSSCYQGSLSFTAISTRMCGLFATTIAVPARVRVEVDQDTQFREGCLAVTVDIVEAETFSRASGSVVSSAFVQSLQLKKLSVVKNADYVIVGQLASDGYQVVFGKLEELDEKQIDVIAGQFRVCFALVEGNRQPGWKHIGVARSRVSTTGDPASANFRLWKSSVVLEATTESEQPYCITVDRSGIYALANYLPDAGSASFFDTLTADQQAALIIVIIVYFFLWLLISVALGNYALWWTIQRTAVKFSVDQIKASLNFSLLWLASAIRWIYFLVVIVGASTDMPKPVEIFMVELPLFFFFSVLTIIILKWVEVARKSGGKNKKPPVFSVSNILAVILNWIMYTLLIIFVILASVGVAEKNPGKCSTATTKENPALSITYHLIVAFICFGLGASFIVIGTAVTIKLLRLGGASTQKVRFAQFTSVAGACSVAMILQAILLVITTAVVVPSIVAIIILIIVEVIPILLLIWTWNKPIAIGKVVSSIASLGSSSRSDTTSSGSSTSGATSSADGSSAGSSTGDNTDTSSTASTGGGGLARLWSLGTDSLDGASFMETE